MTEIQLFDFDGGKFPVVANDRLPSGNGIPIATVCKHLEVDQEKQRQRIERSPWSKTRTSVMEVQLPGDTQRRSVFLLDADRFAMWMATIDTSRLKNPEARERIERWQDEAADALNDYLRTGVAVEPRGRVSDDEIRAAVERQLEKRQYKNVIRDTIGNLKHSNRRMYSDIRDRFLVKVSGMKSRELINSGRPIRTWAGSDGPKPRDYNTGTNYLTAEELDNFNLILDYVALELRRKQPKTYPELLKICSEAVHKAGV